MVERLVAEDVDALSLGAALLGSGGGGSTRLARLLATRLVKSVGTVSVVSPHTFSGLAVSVGLIGAPQIDDEKLPVGEDMLVAVRELSNVLGAPVEAVICQQIGGSNALFAVAAAARLNLPLIDADTMGRAFTRVTMSTPFLNEPGAAYKLVMADAVGRFAMLPACGAVFVDSAIDALSSSFGGVAALAQGPFHFGGGTCSRSLIHGSMSRAHDLGQLLWTSRSVDDICQRLVAGGDIRCFVGRVVGVAEDRSGVGPLRAICNIEATFPEPMPLRLDAQNEFVWLSSDGETLAGVPDIISVLDSKSLEFLVPEDIRYGQEVAVITMESSPVWRTEAGSRTLGIPLFEDHTGRIPMRNV